MTPRYESDNIGSWTRLRAGRDGSRTALVCGAERVDYTTLKNVREQIATQTRC